MKKHVLVAAMTMAVLGLASCGGGGGGGGTAGISTGGSASKGPLDCSAQGSVIATDSSAPAKTATGSTPTVGSFTVALTGMTYPVTVTMSGCKDTITNATQGFDLSTIVMNSSQTVTNATPISTLAVAAAKAKAGTGVAITQADLDAAVSTVLNTFGLSASLSNPLTTSYKTSAEVTNLVMASEAVSEVIKRIATANGASTANVLQSLSADLATGALDGTAPVGVTPAVAIAANAVGTQIATVLNEVAVGNLVVNQVNPTTGAQVAALPASAITSSIAAMSTVTSGATVTPASVNVATVPAATGAGATATAITTAVGNNASITAAAASASSFKLNATTATVQDYDANGAPLAPANATSVTTAAGVMTVTMPTGFVFNVTNASNLTQGVAGAKAPQVQFGLGNIPAGSGTATVTALLKDGANATRATNQRQITATFNVDWSSNGTTLTLTAAAGSASVTYVTATNNTVSTTLTNATANVLQSSGSVGTGTGVQLNAAISNLFNANTTVGTALQAVQVQGNYFYQLKVSGFPLLDSTVPGVAINTIEGTFSVL